MAGNLTGEFDVVAEFAVPAVNRLLAAMHRCERFPHSMSLRVDDTAPPGRPEHFPVLVESVDTFGDAIPEHGHVGHPLPWPGPLAATSAVHAGLGMLVNGDQLTGSLQLPPIVPSHLAGVAQVQVGPPTIEIPDASGTSLTTRLPLRARYRPDPQTARAAEFVHGELRLTAAVNQVVSQPTGLNVVEIDIKANNVQVGLTPTWTSTPLAAEDLAGIQLLLRNALKTSFLPSNATLPARVKHLQLKTLHGGGGAVAVLLNMGPTRGALSSLNDVFVSAGDDFALGVGRTFVLAAFDPVIQNLLTTPVAPVTFHVTFLGDATYTITINGAAADLLAGKIVLTVTGQASGNRSFTPNFSFTTQLSFTLAANGDTVDLVPGDVSVNTSSAIANAIAKGAIQNGVRNARDAALLRLGSNGKNTYANVNELLSADRNLGQFLKSLLNPARTLPGLPPLEDVFLLLWYTSVDIVPSGIALHGALAVGAWPSAHVEYERVAPTAAPGPADGLAGRGPDFSALKAWIPGGVIERFEWTAAGQTQPFVDEHRFVLLHPEPGLEVATASIALRVLSDAAPSPAALQAYAPLCLSVRGSRLSASGPVIKQAVSGSICGYGTFPVLDGQALERAGTAAMVALTQPGPDGRIRIVGHTPAEIARTSSGVPNRVVHFADDQSAARLEVLGQAVRESGRKDAATAVVAVLTSQQLAKVRQAPDVVYGDADGGAWERAFGLGAARRPTTLVVSPRGEITWRHEGPLDPAALAAALRKSLVAGRSIPRTLQALSLRLGRQVPNFLFDLAPGHALTLRKLAGRAAVLVFWRSTSKASIEAVREHQTHRGAGDAPVVLAINDGEPLELARRAAAEHGLSATLVPDPQRTISAAYGVSLWPTTVLIDAQGAATSISYGLATGHHDAPPARDDQRQAGAT